MEKRDQVSRAFRIPKIKPDIGLRSVARSGLFLSLFLIPYNIIIRLMEPFIFRETDAPPPKTPFRLLSPPSCLNGMSY